MRTVELDWIVSYVIWSFPYIKVTITYVLFSLFFGFLIGTVLVKMRKSKNIILRILARIYLTITRCTPSIVLLFVVFYGVPAVLKSSFGVDLENLSVLFYVCVTFSIFIGASSSEIIRSALESVHHGQIEAGLSTGMNDWQVFRRITFPQMLRVAIPNCKNTVIFLCKEGTLAYTIGLKDILGSAFWLSSLEYNVHAIDMYIAVGIIYWSMTILLEKCFDFAELRMKPEYKAKRRRVNEAGL